MAKKKPAALKDIDAPYYSYWQAVYHSFYNAQLYVDVGKRWKGLSMMYLLLLILLVAIPLSVGYIIKFNDYFNQQILVPIQKLPPFYIQNGEVHLDKPMPYLVKNDEGKVVSIIDNTGTITHFEKKYPDLSVLITKNSLLYRSPSFFENFEVQEAPVSVDKFSSSMNQVFNGETWIETSGVKKLQSFATFLIYPAVVIVFFILYLAVLLTVSLLAQLMVKILFKMDLSYGQTYRLLMVGATPQTVLLMMILTFNLMFPMRGIVMLAVFTAYFCFGVLSLKRESNKLVLRDR